MAAVALPDISSLSGATGGVLDALEDIAGVLPVDRASVAGGLDGRTATLNASITIDGAGLTAGLSAALDALKRAVPGDVPALDGVGVGLSQALGALEPLKQALTADGELLDVKSFALDRAGDPVARIEQLLGGLTDLIPAEGLEAVETFVSTVTAFEAAIPIDPAQVATFIGRGFLGVPTDLLAPAQDALEGLLGAFGALVPQAEVAALRERVDALVANLTALPAHVQGIVPADAASYDAALAAIAAFKVDLDAFVAAVTSIATSVGTGLAELDLGALLAPVEAALAAVPHIEVPDTNAFLEIVIEPFRRASELLDAISPEQVAAQIRGWVSFVENEFAAHGLAELEAIVRQPFEQIGDAIEGLQLESIREAFRAALATTMSALAPVTGAITTVRDGVVGALDAVAPAVAGLTSAVGEVEGLLTTVTSAIGSAAGAVSLQGLRDDALALVGELSAAVTDLVGQVGTVVGTLRELIAELGDVDLAGAASSVVDAIGRMTDTLASIDVAPLPDALLSELRSALTTLLDSITLDPLQDTLDGTIDAVPFDVLDSVAAAIGDIVDELEAFSPARLVEPLAGPFGDLVVRLTELHPAEILDPVLEQLQTATAALDEFDPAGLLAPLDAPLNGARAALESVAPGQLLAPLHAPFDELISIVDKLDVTPFLDELETLLGDWIGQAVSGMAELGKPFEAASGTASFVDAVSGTAPVGGDFGFRPGDILRPVQDLYEKVTALLDTVPAATLVAAFEQVRSGLVETLDALSPSHLPACLRDRIDAELDGLDVGAGASLLGALLPRYSALALAVDGIDPAAASGAAQAKHAQLVTLTASIDPDIALAPARAALRSLRSSSVELTGTLELDGVGASIGPVAARLTSLLPDFLREPVTIDAIRAHFDAANPKHLAATVNAEFDALLGKILRFAEVFGAELPKVAGALEGRMQTALAGMLRGAFAAVYDPLRAQLQALDPAGLEADLDQEVYAPVRGLLASLSVEAILGDSQTIQRLGDAKAGVKAVLGDVTQLRDTVGATYDIAVASVVAVSPATLQADLQAAYAPVAEALADLDLGGIAEELRARFERLGDQIGTALQQVLDALRAMVAAISSGIEGVDAQIDISARA